MATIRKRYSSSQEVVLVFDNLRANKTRLIRAFCIKNKFKVLISPKYSSEVNFIENVINRFKKEIRREKWRASWYDKKEKVNISSE